MKIKSYNILFHLFSFLADKTNGAPLFVKYKLLLGTFIIGLTGTSAYAQKKNVIADSIPLKRPLSAEISCYKVYVSPTSDSIEVKGRVVDEEGEPLIGTAIRIQNGIEGSVANLDGYFTLKAKADDILVFSMIGFHQKEIPLLEVKDSDTVVMEVDSIELSCYIVVTAEPPSNRTIKPIITRYSEKEDIKGRVKDEHGEFIPGVSIVVEGTTNGTISDIDGVFSIKAKSTDKLVFSFIGMESKEVSASTLRGGEAIITMKDSDMILCYEVVVVQNYPDDIYRRTPKQITKMSYTEVHTAPVSPVGNSESFQKWVQSNIRYSEQMKMEKVQGEVILSFATDKKGRLVDKKVIGKLSKEADKEALRVLSLSGEWKPGLNNGKPIKTTMTISVKFGDE